MNWKYFGGAAFVVFCALLKAGAPILAVLLGILLAGLLNFKQRSKLKSTQ